MKKHFIYFLVYFLILGCETSFERKFKSIEPQELGEVLSKIDSIEKCKKKWVNQEIISYHSFLKNAEKDEKAKKISKSDYYNETLGEVYENYSKRYNELILKWQNTYDENKKIERLLQIDTAYVTYNKKGELKIAIEFKPSQEIEEASFEMRYISWYNYQNSVEPDREIRDYDNYNLDGKVFRDTLTIIHTPPSGNSWDFTNKYNAIGSNGIIKGKKPDEYDIDYKSARIILTNGEELKYMSLDDMPTDICIDKN